MRFSDGSTMHVRVMESNSPPLKNGARIRAVSEQSVKFTVSCEDDSQIVLILADPGFLSYGSSTRSRKRSMST
jgi:hypothetical protein